MTLRRMTLLVVGLTFLGLIIALFVTLEVTLIRHFNEVETQSVVQNMQRARSALDGDYAILDLAAGQWARSSETTAFLHSPSSTYLDTHLSDSVFRDLGLTLLLIARPDGSLAAGKAFDLQSGQLAPMPKNLPAQLTPGSRLLSPPSSGDSLHALLSTPEGPLLLVSMPVRAASGSIPAFILAGRMLNEAEIQRLSTGERLPLVVMSSGDPNLPPDFVAARSALADGESVFTYRSGEETVSGFSILEDITGVPAYLLRVDQPRTIYRNGRMVMNYLLTALVIAGVVFCLIMLAILERLVLARLGKLSREVQQIGASGDPSRRVTEAGKDELAYLSGGINQMLGSLEEAEAGQRQRVSELDALYTASSGFLSQTDQASVQDSICQLAVKCFGVDAAWLGHLSGDDSLVQPAAFCQIEPGEVQPLPIDWQAAEEALHPAVRAARAGSMKICDGMEASPGLWQPFELTFESLAALPLPGEVGSGAVLVLYSLQPDTFDPQRRELLRSFANLAGMALEKAYLFEQVLSGRQRLQAVSRRMVEVQEDERRRIAMELHDEIGQLLTGLKLLLDTSLALPPEKVAARVQQAQEAVNDLMGRVRQMSLDLRPPMLDDLGLLAALIWLFGRYTAQTHIQVDFQHREIEHKRFTNEIETAAFRAVQESLTNVARYAGVGEVAVRVWNDGAVLNVQVEDHGAGFMPDDVLSSGATRGLVGMRERATTIGGRLTIDSAPGRGACLTVELPLLGYLERRKNDRIHTAGG